MVRHVSLHWGLASVFFMISLVTPVRDHLTGVGPFGLGLVGGFGFGADMSLETSSPIRVGA